jgi:hypothetical protein
VQAPCIWFFVHPLAHLFGADPDSQLQPLQVASPSPSSGWADDFHLQVAELCSSCSPLTWGMLPKSKCRERGGSHSPRRLRGELRHRRQFRYRPGADIERNHLRHHGGALWRDHATRMARSRYQMLRMNEAPATSQRDQARLQHFFYARGKANLSSPAIHRIRSPGDTVPNPRR